MSDEFVVFFLARRASLLKLEPSVLLNEKHEQWILQKKSFFKYNNNICKRGSGIFHYYISSRAAHCGSVQEMKFCKKLMETA